MSETQCCGYMIKQGRKSFFLVTFKANYEIKVFCLLLVKADLDFPLFSANDFSRKCVGAFSD